jgi:hypothetical protein
MARTISYAKRDFASLRQEQIDFIKKYYPEVIQNFNDGSIMSVLLDLNAAIADNLHFHIDRSLQETVLEYAQQPISLYNIARTYGLKLPTKSASVAVCEITIQVPVAGDAEDARYLPLLKAGSQVIGDGQIFELASDVDFSKAVNEFGVVDRVKTPIINNGLISAYRLTKTVVVINGATKIYSQVFDSTQVKPFYQITLPDNNVLSIETIIHKNGTNFTQNPTYDEFFNSENTWYEVRSLAEDRIFIVDKNTPPDNNGLYKGVYEKVDRRFIKEFTPQGFCFLTFGATVDQSTDILDDFLDGNNSIDLRSFINNRSLGLAPFSNTTMYVKYRVGGGSISNIGINTIDSFGDYIFRINGPDPQINAAVEGSLTVTNITPAVGGADSPSLEELRYYISYNFSSQNRAVTLNDYRSIIRGMPSKFGTPAKIGVTQNQNKIEINVITNNNEGKLDSIATTLLLENIATFLSEYRMINDYILVKPGEVIDLGIEVEVLTEDGNQIDIVTKIINEINNEFLNQKLQMGQSLYVGRVMKRITNVPGVLNVNNIKFFNKQGAPYSDNEVNQSFINTDTKEIDISSGVILTDENQILQIRYPELDIVVKPITSNPRRLI